jgi:DNA-directed RNA polymerase specialized sigma24 family protein
MINLEAEEADPAADGSAAARPAKQTGRSPRPFRVRPSDAQRRVDAQLLERIRAAHVGTESATELATTPTHASRPTSSTGNRRETAGRATRVPCPEYQLLASRLVRPAIYTFKDLLRTGKIKKELLDRSLPIGLTSDDYLRLHTSMPARDALAVGVVIAGEDYFRRTVIPNSKWSADGGASLETYFINGCFLHFASAVREWKREHPEWTRILAYADAPNESTDLATDPEAADLIEAVEDRDLIRRLIAKASPLDKSIMLLILEDFSYSEIGEKLGLSARAVEGRLYRFRVLIKKEARRGRLDIPPRLMPGRDAA